jgi:hypothetical protein
MEEVKWSSRKTNEEVRNIVDEERRLPQEIRRRQIKWLHRVVFGEGMVSAVKEGRLLVKWGRRKRRKDTSYRCDEGIDCQYSAEDSTLFYRILYFF